MEITNNLSGSKQYSAFLCTDSVVVYSVCLLLLPLSFVFLCWVLVLWYGSWCRFLF